MAIATPQTTGQKITSTKHHTLALARVPLSLQTPPTCRVSTATPNLGEVPPAEAGVAIGRRRGSMGDTTRMDDPNMERTNMVVQAGMGELEVDMGLEGAGLVGGFKMPPLSEEEEEDRMLLYLEVGGSKTALIVEERVVGGAKRV